LGTTYKNFTKQLGVLFDEEEQFQFPPGQQGTQWVTGGKIKTTSGVLFKRERYKGLHELLHFQ
jgi:hypothetical protein